MKDNSDNSTNLDSLSNSKAEEAERSNSSFTKSKKGISVHTINASKCIIETGKDLKEALPISKSNPPKTRKLRNRKNYANDLPKRQHKYGQSFHYNNSKLKSPTFIELPPKATLDYGSGKSSKMSDQQTVPHSILYKDYIVSYVSGCLGIYLQSPKQQQQYAIMKNKLCQLSPSLKDSVSSDLLTNKDMVFLLCTPYYICRATVYKSEGDKINRYHCTDIDTGRRHSVINNQIYQLPDELKTEKLSIHRYLADVQIQEYYKKDKMKIYNYVTEVLKDKYLTIENVNDYSVKKVNIYYMNDLLNPKIEHGIKSLFEEKIGEENLQNSATSPGNRFNLSFDYENYTNMYAIPASPIIGGHRNHMYDVNGSRNSDENKGFRMKNNFTSMTNLLSMNFDKRDGILERISENSVITKSTQYILKNSSFYAEVDTLLSEGADLLAQSKNRHRISEYKNEKNLNDFYVKSHLINASEIEASLKSFYADLAVVCTEDELTAAKKERHSRPISELDHTFYTFINKFYSWKETYSKCRSKTDELLKEFMCGQTKLVKWVENLLERKTDLTGNLSFDYVQKLCDQLFIEENLVKKGNWIALAVLLTNEEIKRRLNKVTSLLKLSEEIGRVFDNCSYQRNKQFSSESSIPLLSFIRPPKILAPETKCFFICDVYRELACYYQKKMAYKYLSPANILIISKGQATLREINKVETGEPFPPWKFTAPECHRLGSCVTNKADSFSFGQFILWLACIHINIDFDQEMRRIKEACPIFVKIGSDNPCDRPDLLEIEQSFATIFPNAFGVAYSQTYKCLPDSEESEKVHVKNTVTVLQRSINPSESINAKLPPPKDPILTKVNQLPMSKTDKGRESMLYEMSLLKELQDSDDSDEADLEDDLASMIALSHR